MEKKKGRQLDTLNVVSRTQHRGFGAGVLDLNSLSSVIIDGDEAYIDLGAIHGKSKVEKRIKFSIDRESVPNGRLCWIVWVAVGKNEKGSYFAGATACEMLIDTEEGRGFKILADHVNRMDYAMKYRIMLDELSLAEKALLRGVLLAHNADWYANSSDELMQKLEAAE